VGSIAIVTPVMRGRPLPLSHPFFLELLANIGEAARERGCDFTVSHTAPTSFDDLIVATTTSRADGVIFLGQSVLHDEFNRLAGTNARFVVWGAQLPGQLYCSIGSDNLLGGGRATRHLARLGRKPDPVPRRQRPRGDAAPPRLSGSAHRERTRSGPGTDRLGRVRA
jgi:DNA-binding LacI/PurR family transcriptional regulator